MQLHFFSEEDKAEVAPSFEGKQDMMRPKVHFKVTELVLHSGSLHPAHDNLRIAHVSDPHIGWCTPDSQIREAVRRVNQARADLAFITGDFFTVPGAMRIDRLELLAGITCPVYVTLGNHERGARALVIRNAMEQYGYTVLQNETACIEHNGHPICIIGINGRLDSRACMRDMLPDCETSTTIIVLAHNPAAVHSLPHNSGWLCLSGHTHGGHIVIPWITRRLFRACGQPYMAGRYDVNGNVLYVNSGLGYGYGILPRLGTSPEVAVFTLKCRITNPESPDATETNPMLRRALDG